MPAAARRRRAMVGIVLVGVAYGIVGVAFAVPAHGTAFQVRAWRLAAWVVSGALFAGHIGYAYLRLRTSRTGTALQAAVAAALGAFGLAVAANVHWLVAGTPGQRAPLLALPVWPVITAVPAFLGALAVAAVLGRIHHKPGKPSL